jgi:ABC-type antimicrobial peptide transport system permease subunit
MNKSFSIKDLARTKFQTSVAMVSLTICVASTVFLTILSEQIGASIVPSAQDRLISGFMIVLSQYILFVVILIFIVGAVTTSFLSYLMMSSKTRDIGLMKGAGCPNYLALGFFAKELFMITSTGCISGTAIGTLASSLSPIILGNLGLTTGDTPLNLETIGIVFIVFFTLSMLLGAIPIHLAISVEPAKAISPVYHAGVDKEQGFSVVSKRALIFKIGFRSLVRRRKVCVIAILCLTIVFTLVTVAIAGGIIAYSTTGSWVERAVGKDTVLVADQNLANQYKLLLSKPLQNQIATAFNYADDKYSIPQKLNDELKQIPNTSIESRLIVQMHIKEVHNFTIDSSTLETTFVGDDRQGQSLAIGIDPQKVTSNWFMQGRIFQKNNSLEAMIGDSLAASMFSVPLNQSMQLNDTILNIRGVCTDPMNNGNVTYVPISTLQKITGIKKPNLFLVEIDTTANRTLVMNQISNAVRSIPNFTYLDLNEAADYDLSYLGHVWLIAMLPALVSLAIAGLCLASYVMLAVSEQRQDFSIIRALGVGPKGVMGLVSWQVATVLLASYVFGVAFGIIITLMILVPEPVITEYSVLQIASLLLAALLASFAISLLPTLRFARKAILDILGRS